MKKVSPQKLSPIEMQVALLRLTLLSFDRTLTSLEQALKMKRWGKKLQR